MKRLTLVGPSDDGLHLVVEAEPGDRFELPLSDELRHAVRYTRPARPAPQEADADAAQPVMSPRQIQQRIRGGLTAAELAELTGAPLSAIEKYEGPVVAERRYIADLARDTRIGRDDSAPVLGDLVTDRLAARGVDPESVAWDAWREADEPWRVAAEYAVSGRGVRAVWAFDHASRTVSAEDEEARWLSETELLDVPIPRRHLSAVREEDTSEPRPLAPTRPQVPSAAPDQPEPAEATEGSEAATEEPRVHQAKAEQADAEESPELLLPLETVSPTELLLEDLELRRGTREPVPDDGDEDDEDVFEGFGPQRARQSATGFGRRDTAPGDETAGRRTARSHSSEPASPEPADRRASRRGRASVPSWDEIVFGAKTDPS